MTYHATSNGVEEVAVPSGRGLDQPLNLASLAAAYEDGSTVSALVAKLERDIDRRGDDGVWISRVTLDDLQARAADLDDRRAAGERLPLFGIPFAVKDNIDVAGMTTTAGCPGYGYQPERSATVVTRLEQAGAVLIGKTNMDQFATGLVGVRSPYGVARNPFDPDYVPGGSSSGSAVAVSAGLVSFALGTDTAGSGRVPASFNNLVGLKPTRGLISAAGVVPACRSLDCVSIFALSAVDAGNILSIASGVDALDPFSRAGPAGAGFSANGDVRLGVPKSEQLDFFGDSLAAGQFAVAVDRARTLGWSIEEIDYGPFSECAALLYGGPWVAERYTAVGDFMEAHPGAALPVLEQIVLGGARSTARDYFEASYRLKALRQKADTVFTRVDALLLPTAGTIYTVDQLQADPIALNNNLGLYTNFMNLFDLAGIAVPSGMRDDGLPFGVTFAGPAFSEQKLIGIGQAFQVAAGLPMGATGNALPADPSNEIPASVSTSTNERADALPIAVVGAHMRGQPLNPMLAHLGGRFLRAGETAACYRLVALPGGPPDRPGLVRVPTGGGGAIELELWALPLGSIGDLLDQIEPPLGLGSIELSDGSIVKGFICEGFALDISEDITAYGGWRGYLAANQKQSIEA